MFVSGVVLAAGSSSRLGRPKQLLELDTEPISRIVTRNALSSRLAEVVVVLGAHADEVAKAIGNLGQRTVVNPDFHQGQSLSLRTGLAAVSHKADAVMFLLGDQPDVGPEIIDQLIGAFERTDALIIQPLYGTHPGNPVLFSRKLFPDLEQTTGDQGARELVRRRRSDLELIVVSGGPPPADVDTEADYQALLARWAARGGTGSGQAC